MNYYGVNKVGKSLPELIRTLQSRSKESAAKLRSRLGLETRRQNNSPFAIFHLEFHIFVVVNRNCGFEHVYNLHDILGNFPN